MSRKHLGKQTFDPTPKEAVVSVRNKVLTFYDKYYGDGNKKPILGNLIQFQNQKREFRPSEHYDNYEDWLVENYQEDETKQRAYNGFISAGTKRRVSKYLETWVESVNTCKNGLLKKYREVLPYFTFVTLTLASTQKHDDKFIKKNILSRWIEKEQKRGTFKFYFWRAESQKNGNIHFHLLVDKFIPYEALRSSWNQSQGLYGYIEGYRDRNLSKYKDGFFIDYSQKRWDKKRETHVMVSPDEQRKSYEFGCATNWSEPNSTDIRKISNVKDLSAYLLKYFTKNSKDEERNGFTCVQSRTIEGRIIGKSKGLEKLECFVISSLDANFVDWLHTAERDNLVEKEIDVVGNRSVMVLLGRFAHSIKKHALHRKLIWYHLRVIRKLYLPDLPEEIMANPY